MEVEQASRDLKDVIEMRPIYHHTKRRVEAHIFVAALAPLLQHAIGRKLQQAGLDLSAEEALGALATVQLLDLELPQGESKRLVTRGSRRALYEYAVLLSSLDEGVATIAQQYRDRADAENNFDELKNQWSWPGFTTQDLLRCQVLARIAALVDNWWTLFTRLPIPAKHGEVITTRLLLLHGLARRTRHGHPTAVTITSLHERARLMKAALQRASAFLQWLQATAEQLTRAQRWRLIPSWIFRQFLRGRVLGTTSYVTDAL